MKRKISVCLILVVVAVGYMLADDYFDKQKAEQVRIKIEQEAREKAQIETEAIQKSIQDKPLENRRKGTL